ncbi:DoxX family protein [Burkholderia stagnalis]|uniref:DoxX family protein n=1 Tax=Burkholderia stagnalis TaxID=1503054 RepID=A0ABX9YQG0_9BURK|nr:DoxX family protein [Burkholderia stagnalis]RQY93824.1 DoxX family protein [Burkholderia stagnalis]RQZ19546.1 DoxX family protein [Burkholderia stagnalis]
MPHLTRSNIHRTSVTHCLLHVAQSLERVPYWLLAIPLRLAVATVFWNSAMTKLANWDAALDLFRDEYRVPVLPPGIAAYLAVSIELSMPVLLVLGLGTRPAAFVLLGMTSVIEIFVYPQAWPTHIQWAAMLLVLLCRGAGRLSLDDLTRRRWSRSMPSGESRTGP